MKVIAGAHGVESEKTEVRGNADKIGSEKPGKTGSAGENESEKMRIIGVTGGVGSGKSEVLQFLKEAYQAEICPLDEVARRLQQSGQRCFDRIVEAFGTDILGRDGELDRQKLGKIVFADFGKRMLLNEIVHPEVKHWVRQDIERKHRMHVKLYVIESAILPEVGYEDICEETWYIYAEEAVRMERLQRSRGYTKERTVQMMKAQPSKEAFEKGCTVRIDNNGTFEDTKRQIGERL